MASLRRARRGGVSYGLAGHEERGFSFIWSFFQDKLILVADLDAYKQRTRPDGVKKVGRPRKGQEPDSE